MGGGVSELGDDNWLPGCQFLRSMIRNVEDLPKRSWMPGVLRREIAVTAEADPINHVVSRVVILEAIPSLVWMVVRIGVPHPNDVVRSLTAYQFDDVAPCCHKALRSISLVGIAKPIGSLTAVVFSIPAEPMPIHLSAEFNQEGSSKFASRARPCAKILVELPSQNGLHRKRPLAFAGFMVLGSKHQANVRHSAVRANPRCRLDGKGAARVPVVRKI